MSDRFIQQALLQVIQPKWDRTFSRSSFGFRPYRSAHQAVQQSCRYINAGYNWVVDMDLEKFFDRVNHDVLMHRVKQRIDDTRVLKLINGYLKSGAMLGDHYVATDEGAPQGGPLSPLLANLLLDDCNIYVKSLRAGERVLASLSHWLQVKLKLRVNDKKSAVDRPWKRSFLGFTFTARGREKRIKVSDKSLHRLKMGIRTFTRRTRGRTINHIAKDLREFLLGWKAYFGISPVRSPLRDIDKWIRRKLRCYIWKQWGRSGYRQLRKRGVERFLAWNTLNQLMVRGE